MKLLMVVAKEGFRDEEYQVPYDYFKDNQITVDVASKEKGDCFGKFGTVITADKALEDVSVTEYFAIVLVGGPGTPTLYHDPQLERIIKEADKRNLIIAAICLAPVILAQAGILEGKKATVWDEDKKQNPILFKYGADYVNQAVVVDDRIITANGPAKALHFAQEIVHRSECEDCHIK